MNDVTRLIEQIDRGDLRAADELLPIVYQQLRLLARKHLAREAQGISFQSADLVHEAYLRLAGADRAWQGGGHFFAAAAEAMRRILVERARKKKRLRHGGGLARVEFDDATASSTPTPDEVILVSDLLDSFELAHPLEARIVKLHYFAGMSISEVGRVLAIPGTTVHRHWVFARAWLREALRADSA